MAEPETRMALAQRSGGITTWLRSCRSVVMPQFNLRILIGLRASDFILLLSLPEYSPTFALPVKVFRA